MSLNFKITGDNEDLKRKLAETRKAIQNAGKDSSETSKQIATQVKIATSSVSDLQKAFLKLGGTAAFAGLMQQIVTVRGEFQQLGIAFETMLGSKEKADAMMAEIKELALTTPFTITDVADNTKQLIAMGIATEKVMDTMKALGDVAAGVSVPMSRIAVNYGQVSALGRLQSREIRDFAMAGIPIVEELAKMLGKTSAEIYAMTEAGQVGFPLVEQAFINMSSEGGKFYDMMRKTNTSLTGQLSKLKDEFKLMFDAIGEANEGIIYSAIGTASDLVANYEKIGKILVSLVATYGAYRAALAVVIATEKGYTIAQLANYKALLMVEKAQKLLNATMLKNPYVLAATLVMGLVTAMWALHDSTTAAEKAQKQFADKNQAISDASEKRKESAKELISIIQDESQAETDRLKAYNELVSLYPTLFKDIDIEKVKVAELTGLVKSLNEEESKRYGRDKQNQLNGLYAQRDSKLREINDLGQSPNGNRRIRKKEAEENLKIINSQIKALEDEKKAFLELQKQSGKKEPDSVYGEDYETARKAWEKEKALLESILKDRDKYTTKEYEYAVEAEKAKRETFEKLGGITKADTSARKEQERLAKERLAKEKEIANELLRLQSDNIDAGIALMEEGHEKRFAEIHRAYDKEIAALQEKEAEWRAAQGGKLTVEQTAELDKGHENAYKELQKQEDKQREDWLKAEKDAWNEYYREYGTYEEKRLAITEHYAALIGKAQTDGEKATLAKDQEAALNDLDNSMMKQSDLWKNLFADASKMSKNQLQEVIANTKQLIDYINGVDGVTLPVGFKEEDIERIRKNPKEFAEIYDKLIEKQNEFEKNNQYPFSGLINGFKKLKESAETYEKALAETNEKKKKDLENDAEMQRATGMKFLREGAIEAADGVSSLADVMQELADVTGDARLARMGEELKSAGNILSKAAEGSKAGPWGALIGVAVGTLESIKTGVFADMAKQRAWQNETEKFQQRYNRLLAERNYLEETFSSVFGTDNLARAEAAYDTYQKALKDYNDALNKTLEGDTSNGSLQKDFLNPLGIATEGMDTFVDNYLPGWVGKVGDTVAKVLGKTNPILGWLGIGSEKTNKGSVLKDAMERGMNALQGELVQISSKRWYKIGSKDKFTTLFDMAPELWGGSLDGEFDVEAAREFLSVNTQISEETRLQLENVIELQEAYEEALQVVRDDIQDTFGHLGTAAVDSLVDSIKNGADAWKTFKESGVEALEKLGEKIASELFFSKALKDLQTKLEETYNLDGSENIANEQAKLMDEFFASIGGQMEAAQEWMKQWQAQAAEKGYDIWASDTEKFQQSSRGGFETMSQDQASELSGRFTALYDSGEGIRINTGFIMMDVADIRRISSTHLEVSTDMRDIALDCVFYLGNIDKNTAVLPSIRDVLNQMDEKLKRL